jgi:hypothetical protein
VLANGAAKTSSEANMTKTEAIEQINQAFREDFPLGAADFAAMRDRFERGLEEAFEYGDDYVCVKVPSYSEASFPVALVQAALA